MTNSTSMPENHCTQIDQDLAKWTFARYLVLASIVGGRIYFKMKKKNSAEVTAGAFLATAREFALSEGVGLVIYFVVSAMMDNITIFFASGEEADRFCGYVDMVALYSFAVLAFLPICFVTFTFQKPLYDEGVIGQKAFFIIAMVVITAMSFQVRLVCVYDIGWAAFVNKLMVKLSTSAKIATAVCVPPVVDALQSSLLIFAGAMHGTDHVIADGADQGYQPAGQNEAGQLQLEKNPRSTETPAAPTHHVMKLAAVTTGATILALVAEKIAGRI